MVYLFGFLWNRGQGLLKGYEKGELSILGQDKSDRPDTCRSDGTGIGLAVGPPP